MYVSFDLGSMKNLSKGITELDKTQYKVRGILIRTSTMIVHNHVLNKPIMSTRFQWLGQERSDYNIRWIHSLFMSMHILRMIYYLIEVQCLSSGLKNMPWTDRPLSVQRKQVEDDVLLFRFWLPNSWWILYNSWWFQPNCYIWMENGEVYLHMQLTARPLELCRLRYACFSEPWPKPTHLAWLGGMFLV